MWFQWFNKSHQQNQLYTQESHLWWIYITMIFILTKLDHLLENLNGQNIASIYLPRFSNLPLLIIVWLFKRSDESSFHQLCFVIPFYIKHICLHCLVSFFTDKMYTLHRIVDVHSFFHFIHYIHTYTSIVPANNLSVDL